MNHLPTFVRPPLLAVALLAIGGCFPNTVRAQPSMTIAGQGFIRFSNAGTSAFVLQGNGVQLGRYVSYGEVDFVPGETPGSMIGFGVVAIRDAKGHLLVGNVFFQTDENGNGQIRFSWRNSIRFGNGALVSNTGRFLKSRPPGAVSRLKSNDITDGTSNIIAILIG